MADEQFTLGEALGGYEQAKADRDFYLSMVQGGTKAASPIAAYLAGMAGVKASQMRTEAEQIQDAQAATERAMKRGETLRNNLFQLAKSARGGEIAPASAATLAGAIVKEMGYTPREFDTDNMILTYSKDGEDYELDLSESPISKQQREAGKLALAEAREDRLAKQAEMKKKMDQARLDNLLKGKKSSGSSSEETKFLQENKDLFDNVFNPKSKMTQRLSLEARLAKYVNQDKTQLQKWLRGVKTLDEDAQERLGEYTNVIQAQLDALGGESDTTNGRATESSLSALRSLWARQ